MERFLVARMAFRIPEYGTWSLGMARTPGRVLRFGIVYDVIED
jgi:hypothetical protein